MSEAMIEARNVVKAFDGFRALDVLTMTVPRGSIYGLVGPNGAGKSTLLRHVTGIYRQDSGSVLLEGNPIYENPAAKARIASIPDELYYFLSASTRDMMKFYRGLYPQFDDKRYQALKDAFPAVDEKQPIRRLSKGMQKQSAFWLALCCMPDILVLDEPVDGLDPEPVEGLYHIVDLDHAVSPPSSRCTRSTSVSPPTPRNSSSAATASKRPSSSSFRPWSTPGWGAAKDPFPGTEYR